MSTSVQSRSCFPPLGALLSEPDPLGWTLPLLEDASQPGRAPRARPCSEKRVYFCRAQSWVRSQGKHLSGWFPGPGTSSWFPVCRSWRTPSPRRGVRAGEGAHGCPSLDWDQHPGPPYARPRALPVCPLWRSLHTPRTVPIPVHFTPLPFSGYCTPS